jgi:hypothetical protein
MSKLFFEITMDCQLEYEAWKGPQIASGHTFWSSFPTLQVALNIANNGLWLFGPNIFGLL